MAITPFRKVVSNLSAIESNNPQVAIETIKQVLYQVVQFLETSRELENEVVEEVAVVEAIVEEGVAGDFPSREIVYFYGEDTGGSVTDLLLMGANHTLGVTVPRDLVTANVSVKFRRATGAAPGNWTMRLYKNGLEAATFTTLTT